MEDDFFGYLQRMMRPPAGEMDDLVDRGGPVTRQNLPDMPALPGSPEPYTPYVRLKSAAAGQTNDFNILGSRAPGSGIANPPEARSASPRSNAAPTTAAPTTFATSTGPVDIAGYIRQAALSRGINPEVALRIAQSEGGLTNPVQQSNVINPTTGRREESYGPYQLYMNGGLGNAALDAGIDPRNPAHWQRAVDFALDHARRYGWSPWHGRVPAGVGEWDGIPR